MPKAGEDEELAAPLWAAASGEGAQPVAAASRCSAQQKKLAAGAVSAAVVVVVIAVLALGGGGGTDSPAPSPAPPSAPGHLPSSSRCDTLCPGCTTLGCECPAQACWPGSGVDNTPDHTCGCFAKLSFCKAGTKPEYSPGAECPSCWPPENKACECFASLGFCGPGTDGPPFGIAGTFDSFVLARFWDPPAARPDGGGPRTNLTLHGVWPQYDTYKCMQEVLGHETVMDCDIDHKPEGHGWPQYCGAEHATNWELLDAIVPSVRKNFYDRWAIYAPGYLDEKPHNFATHEWTKHGTCSRGVPNDEYTLAAVVDLQEKYFEMQIQLMTTWPTPELLQNAATNASAVLTYEQLIDAFSGGGMFGPRKGVALSCDAVPGTPHTGRLIMVSMCFDNAWEDGGVLTRNACSEETCLSSDYDNGCKNFQRILVDGKA